MTVYIVSIIVIKKDLQPIKSAYTHIPLQISKWNLLLLKCIDHVIYLLQLKLKALTDISRSNTFAVGCSKSSLGSTSNITENKMANKIRPIPIFLKNRRYNL